MNRLKIMKVLRYISMCLCAVVAVMLTACSDDEGVVYGDFNYDMVTYSGENEGSSVFTFQTYNDSPLITLLASNVSSPDMPVGQRLLLNYVVKEDLGGNAQLVKVNGYSKVNTDTILVLQQEIVDTLKMDDMKLKSIWRTGNYLNIRCQLQYSEKPRRMFLATTGGIDENGMVKCYQIQDLMGADTYYWLETYFSYYIEPVWSVSDCTALRYYVNDLTYPDVKYYDFLKE